MTKTEVLNAVPSPDKIDPPPLKPQPATMYSTAREHRVLLYGLGVFRTKKSWVARAMVADIDGPT